MNIMNKNTNYFPHDYHAHQDPKCSALINDFGFAGYGLYWSIVEILHEQGGQIKKFPKLIEGLAFQLKVDKDYMLKLIEALLHDYKLLEQNENCIWSERVIRNIEERNKKYLAKMEAGRIGGLRSGESRRMNKNEAVLEANEQNKRKLKEIKLNYIFIPPTIEEITSYCKERNNKVDPKTFLAHYQANGWVRGKTKIKDWKACIWTWEKNAGFKQQEEKVINIKPDPKQQEEVSKLIKKTMENIK